MEDWSQYKYIDISPLVSEKIGVFPGDTPYKREELLSFERGNNILLSAIRTTVHLGSHADAPNHYHPDGKGIDQSDLSRYLGLCQVIDVSPSFGDRVSWMDLKNQHIEAPRVLLKTGSFPNSDEWNSDFKGLEPALIEELSAKGVFLIGIDTPSIDPESSKELPCHRKVHDKGISVLEGLDLQSVKPGFYQLIALPLKLRGADASPLRAILVKTQ